MGSEPSLVLTLATDFSAAKDGTFRTSVAAVPVTAPGFWPSVALPSIIARVSASLGIVMRAEIPSVDRLCLITKLDVIKINELRTGNNDFGLSRQVIFECDLTRFRINRANRCSHVDHECPVSALCENDHRKDSE